MHYLKLHSITHYSYLTTAAPDDIRNTDSRFQMSGLHDRFNSDCTVVTARLVISE
jgi:hypothetical protein